MQSEQQVQRGRSLRRYVVEFFVIFLGVSLSFFAENVRENRQDRLAERESLRRLVRDIDSDLTDFRGNLETAEAGLEAVDWILSMQDSAAPPRDSLELRLRRFLVCSVMVANASEYESLKNSGDLRLLSDTEFRHDLTTHYELYPIVAQLHSRDCEEPLETIELIEDQLSLDPDGFYYRVRIVGNVEDVMTNRRFRNALTKSRFSRNVVRYYNDLLISRLEALRAQALELL